MADRPMVSKCIHTNLRAHARGLCQRCYKVLSHKFSTEEFNQLYPTTRKPQINSTGIASIYEDLSEIGVTMAEVARKLNITVNAVEMAVARKKKADEDKIIKNFVAEVEAVESLNRIDDMPSHGYWGAGD